MRIHKADGKNKVGVKVHLIIDAYANNLKYSTIEEAKMHDINFLKHLIRPQGSMIVFNKEYSRYFHFARWTRVRIKFVYILKDKIVYKAQVVLFEKMLTEKMFVVMK